MRILSIDDETNFTDMLRQYFEPRGHEIDVTSDGTDGLELMKRKKYDVVLLDLKMPGLSGEQVLEKIKESGQDVKAIFITAYGDFGKTKEMLMKKGAYAFLEKPIASLKELERIMTGASNGEIWEES